MCGVLRKMRMNRDFFGHTPSDQGFCDFAHSHYAKSAEMLQLCVRDIVRTTLIVIIVVPVGQRRWRAPPTPHPPRPQHIAVSKPLPVLQRPRLLLRLLLALHLIIPVRYSSSVAHPPPPQCLSSTHPHACCNTNARAEAQPTGHHQPHAPHPRSPALVNASLLSVPASGRTANKSLTHRRMPALDITLRPSHSQ